MKTRFGSLLFLGVLVAVTLSAATKTAGTATCKMDPASPPPVAVSDQPNHALAIGNRFFAFMASPSVRWGPLLVVALNSMLANSRQRFVFDDAEAAHPSAL